MKQLVCDLGVQLRGHNLGFIQNIIRLLNERGDGLEDREITFLFNTPVHEYLGVQPNHDKINVLYITDQENEELEKCTKLTDRRAAEWLLIKKYAGQQAVEEVIILELDQYQLSIGASTTPFKVSGIYFRPHYRIETIGSGLGNRFKYWLWRQKKLALEYYMCRNKSLHNIFILNDSRAVNAMNRKLGDVFRYLSDPIYDYEPVPTQIRQTYQIGKDRFIFLIFGAIDERKNIEVIAEAFKALDPAIASKAALLIVGKVKSDYEMSLSASINQLKVSQPSLQVITDNRFIGDGEMETLFSQCDVPILLYRDFFVSSGLLGIAAKHNKAVLASTYGVLGELTKTYKLGLCLSPKDISGIAACVSRLVNHTESARVDGSPFYLSHSPNDFLNQLFRLNVKVA
ncbi:glycosyltransferase [Spirosoma linguale]|uniref:Glycosyl transferase group 1 n=1 Tax=Spirosoma linguale (strain ATCC 33905 / DSM 74 / LMG 10896 / Claus 1) TaxID=504472 RepID=D2QU80_SPILD|nr:glycosyl transferase group 1 [Spirosoma linguale DSM 74]